MKKVLLFLICLHSSMYAQSLFLQKDQYSIRLPEGEISFKVDTSCIAIKFKEEISNKEIGSFLKSTNMFLSFDTSYTLPFPKIVIANFDNNKSKTFWQRKINDIQKNEIVDYAAPVLIYNNNHRQVLYNLFYVKLKDSKDINKLKIIAESQKFIVGEEYENNIFFCRVNKHTKGNTFEISKYLQQLNLFEFAEPDFIYNCKLASNDMYFS
ncbi:MAG: hypothetical protein IPP32_16520 [Bacteroidetes bacterium]|nr:hypothetical protein [Bacteroidota bacterium]